MRQNPTLQNMWKGKTVFNNSFSSFADSLGEIDKNQSQELGASHHVLVCGLQELGSLVQSLGTAATPLVSEPATCKSQCNPCYIAV